MATKQAGVTGAARAEEQTAVFEQLLERQTPEVRALARDARALLQRLMPDVVETVWLDQGTASYGVGPKKMSEHFVYFTFAKAHLGLGFYYGAELPDPAGLLQGSGKSMRSAKIATAADVARPELETLVRTASAHLPKLAERSPGGR